MSDMQRPDDLATQEDIRHTCETGYGPRCDPRGKYYDFDCRGELANVLSEREHPDIVIVADAVVYGDCSKEWQD